MTAMMNCRFEAVCGAVSDEWNRGSSKPQTEITGCLRQFSGEEKRSRIKAQRRRPPCRRTSARSAGSFGDAALGSKAEEKNTYGVPVPFGARKHSIYGGVNSPERNKDE